LNPSWHCGREDLIFGETAAAHIRAERIEEPQCRCSPRRVADYSSVAEEFRNRARLTGHWLSDPIVKAAGGRAAGIQVAIESQINHNLAKGKVMV
jgi:hypothetical protein